MNLVFQEINEMYIFIRDVSISLTNLAIIIPFKIIINLYNTIIYSIHRRKDREGEMEDDYVYRRYDMYS